MGGTKQQTVILTARDRHLLDELRVLRLVDREQAALFAPFTSVTRANARLLALTRAGVLKRYFVGTINGGRKAIYSLPGASRPKTPRGQVGREGAVAHQLAVNQVYYAFKYGVPPQPGIQFLAWQKPEGVLSPQVPLIPDGIVRFRTRAGEKVACVEVDLGTETLGVWQGKIERYLKLARTGEYRITLGAERFSVLVVLPGLRRMLNVEKLIAEQTDRVFWLATTKGTKVFDAWGPIWFRPRGGKGISLLG